ncbi:MAG: gliding motility-associated C-terminal domain-containing protein [Saprospiraceae bacterium]
MKFKTYGLIFFIVGLAYSMGMGQIYFVFQRVGPQGYLHKLKLNCQCADCCQLNLIGPTVNFQGGLTMSPDGKLYANDYTNHIYQIDTLSGATTLIFTLPPQPRMLGLVTLGGGIFYSMLEISPSLADTLIEINVNTGVVTKLGVVPYKAIGDMTVYNGEIYYYYVFPNNWNIQYWGIVKLNVNDPASSTLVVDCEINCCFLGFTASNQCQTVLGQQSYSVNQYEHKLVTISLVDGAVTEICDLPEGTFSFTSMEEFSSPVYCNSFDLDCNDSSGATNADYNAQEVNCLSNECSIADSDIGLIYDSKIAEVTVHLTGSLPDAPDEYLKYTGMIAALTVTGAGTDMITLTNGGTATGTNFKNALHAIHYRNVATPFTPGPRLVEVQYTLESGVIGDLATAFISVVDLPVLQVDLGPDQVLCEGENDTLNAGNPGASYQWSNGLTTQNIITNQPGTYSVTVGTNGFCPGSDEISLEFIPVINVSLDGPQEVCLDNIAALIINTDSPFPLTIEIGTSTGSSFVLNNVTGNFIFTDSPSEGTLYTILQVTPSSPACVEVLDSFQFVDVFPTYSMLVDTSMCEGDSLFIGNNWVTKEGNYEYTYSSAAGCDSMVTTFVLVWPSIHLTTQSTTCDPSATGIFVSYLNDPVGCDTVVKHTVTLLPSDTTLVSLLSCKVVGTGINIQMLTNLQGCDSIVITTTTYQPSADTTFLFQTTCDSSLLGLSQQILPASDGCDSLILTTISMAPSDTTYLIGISCDSASIGIFQTILSNQFGCDSLVITSIAAGIPDTTLLFTSSCDSSSLGIFENHFTTSFGCDSTVIRTVSYSAHDSTFILNTTCDPSQVTVLISQYTNQFGCDSIVTETISLLPSGEIFISSTTCDPTAAGSFDYTYVNQFGCDSLVHETITLLPTSETFNHDYTCDPSAVGTFVSTFQNQFGCDSMMTLSVELNWSDTTELFSFTCDPNELSRIETTFTNQSGCDSLVIESTILFPLTQLQLNVLFEFNGYGISCFEASDGTLMASVSGQGPFQFAWSNADTGKIIKNLNAGPYSVIVTDGNGCQTEGFITLNQPEEFTIGFEVSQPDCFGQNQGIITVMQTGGVQPIRYSIDGINFQSSSFFSGLNSGSYTITALDANGCQVQEIIWINVPLTVHVDLGADRILLPGDTTMIEALVNLPFDSLSNITWTGLSNPVCPTCLTQPVAPIITTAYFISVTNTQGCSDQDSVVVFLQKNIDIYIPNIFSPNGDGINDRLLISAGSEVEEIESMEIFDRWGNMIFLATHFPPNDPTYSWTGMHDGSVINPGVFAFRLVARFKNGKEEVRNGDVTVIK